MASKRIKKKKPTRFREISFKLSERQKKSLERYCKARKTTPIKLIKKSIQNYLNLQFVDKTPDYITPNQLDLFIEAEAMQAAEPHGEGYKPQAE
nr:hypothetical protein [Bacteroidota bacterium]